MEELEDIIAQDPALDADVEGNEHMMVRRNWQNRLIDTVLSSAYYSFRFSKSGFKNVEQASAVCHDLLASHTFAAGGGR